MTKPPKVTNKGANVIRLQKPKPKPKKLARKNTQLSPQDAQFDPLIDELMWPSLDQIAKTKAKSRSLTALLDAAAEASDTSTWMLKLLQVDDTLPVLRWFVHETLRGMAKASTVISFDPASMPEIRTWVETLNKFAHMFDDEETPDDDTWAALPDEERLLLYSHASRLFLLLDVVTAETVWRSDCTRVETGWIRSTPALAELAPVYEYFAMMSGDIEF